jgi:hypothetical protein
VEREEAGWRVRIVDLRRDDVVAERACGDREEAELFASTVRQHAGWLSVGTFRDYYGLGE